MHVANMNQQWVCFNDMFNSEFAIKTDNDWSCCQAHHLKWICYNDKSIVNLLIESINEWNKLYYMHVVDTNETMFIECNKHERNNFVTCM